MGDNQKQQQPDKAVQAANRILELEDEVRRNADELRRLRKLRFWYIVALHILWFVWNVVNRPQCQGKGIMRFVATGLIEIVAAVALWVLGDRAIFYLTVATFIWDLLGFFLVVFDNCPQWL
eukprot:EG_transcript_43993